MVDIGWIIGYFYVIYGLLVNGVISVLFEGIFIYLDVNCLWSIVDKYKVIKFYIVFIVICLFMKFGDEFVIKYSWVFLQVLGIVGEFINFEVWLWYYWVVGVQCCFIVDIFW